MGLYPDVARISRFEFGDEISNASSILVNGQGIVDDPYPVEVLAIQRDEVLHLPGKDPEPKGKLVVSGFDPAYFLDLFQIDHHIQLLLSGKFEPVIIIIVVSTLSIGQYFIRSFGEFVGRWAGEHGSLSEGEMFIHSLREEAVHVGTILFRRCTPLLYLCDSFPDAQIRKRVNP